MKVLLLLGVLALGGFAEAQTPTDATTPALVTSISPENQKALDEAKRLIGTVQLWSEPLDWKEEGTSTVEIVAHIRKSLGAKAPPIEVRSKDLNRSTFALEKAPLGPTMWALADLANAEMWVFPGRLVLAPESALTPIERTAIKNRLGGEWQGDLDERGARWNPYASLEKISLLVVGSEIKARLAAKGAPSTALKPLVPSVVDTPASVNTPTVRTVDLNSLAYRLPLNELSPTVQQVVQDLYDVRHSFMRAQSGPLKTLPTTTMVEFDDTQPIMMKLHLENPQTAEGQQPEELGRWLVLKPTITVAQ